MGQARTYSTDRVISKIFITSLRLIGRAGKETFKFSGPYFNVRPAKFESFLSLPIKSRVLPERYNKAILLVSI